MLETSKLLKNTDKKAVLEISRTKKSVVDIYTVQKAKAAESGKDVMLIGLAPVQKATPKNSRFARYLKH